MASIWKAACRAWGMHPGDRLRFALIQGVFRLMAWAPLLFLCKPALRPLALISLPLMMILLLFRQNAAASVQAALEGDGMCTPLLLDLSDWKQRLAIAMKQAGLILLWALPCLAATGFLYAAFTGLTDAFSLIIALRNLGGGETVRGISLAIWMYLMTFLPLMFGLAYHSWVRHAFVLGQPLTGEQKMILGHRWLLIRAQLMGLVTMLPFVIAAFFISRSFVSALVHALKHITSGAVFPQPNVSLLLVGAAYILLYLPLMPLRKLLAGAAVRSLMEDRSGNAD